jgi:sterol desaturase/sphingolipid hydroxylase (fatty acid hydroxylase superfamily)
MLPTDATLCRGEDIGSETMDDLKYGKRNKRGDWAPDQPLSPGPLLLFPWKPMAVLKWIPGYFLPWNAFFFLTAAVFWVWLTPDLETMKTLSPGWIAYLLARNIAWVLVWYGAWEFMLYVKRRQGNQFKYNAKWPSETPSDVFMFKSQNIDNAIRTFASGVPIWTAYEVVILWVFANGWVPWMTWADNKWWLLGFGLVLPIIHEFHFYCVHRLIHVPIFYRWIHSVHHNSVNPTPWSSLSMHPVEHLLYWSGSLIHLILPSHPLLALYHLHIAGTGAIVGHIGFDKVVLGEESAVDTHTFAHYLHHKFFEVNYADGSLPIDKWFGTWHDGTKEGDALMNARWEKKRAKMNAQPGE